MASVIESNMTICDKRIRVTADLREDGTVGIRIESDCDALKGFAENLKSVTMDDITSFETSRINREDVRGNMSMICTAPILVYQAAWMECGMLSRRIYPKMGPITIDMGGEE
jgi:hypothetical protein